MNVGGLFSGIGGWELGLERAGMRVLWHCESDPFCQRVLAARWPGIPCYPDVSELRGADVAPVDVLCGGFPCQDISVAGRGAGIGGARSGLWSEMFRLTGELRPGYLVVENVPALLVRGLDIVLGDLASIGFDAEWDCLRACDFGAPHLGRHGNYGKPEADRRNPTQTTPLTGSAAAPPPAPASTPTRRFNHAPAPYRATSPPAPG